MIVAMLRRQKVVRRGIYYNRGVDFLEQSEDPQ